MGIEKSFNEEGQEQVIDNFDKIIKVGDKFLQVRLIKTRRFDKGRNQREFCEPMPRARLINPNEHFYYLVTKKDVIKLEEVKDGKKIKRKRNPSKGNK